MKMLQKIALLLLIFSVLFFPSCTDDEGEDPLGDWLKVTPFSGSPRSGAITFTIGNVAYVGLGYNNNNDEYKADFYAYDIEKGYWEPMQSFPGTLRQRAVAFAIDGVGYMGLGYNHELDTEELGDWWKFDPATGEWEQLADFTDFGGSARYNAVGFAIGSKGYIGTGYDGENWKGDFWAYNPADDSWQQINSYPGEKIEEGMTFVLNDKAYICGGRNNGLYNNNFWEYDPANNKWTSMAPDDEESYYDEFYAAVRRHNAVALTLDNIAYIIGGVSSSAAGSSVYAYDATTQEWEEKTSFEGSARSLAIGFVLDGRIFMGTGTSGSRAYDDIWEFLPFEEYDEDY